MSNSKNKVLENYENIRGNLLSLGYKEHISYISVLKANIFALLTAGQFAVILVFLYLIVWRGLYFHMETLAPIVWVWGIIVLSIPIHEFLHGFTWQFFCKNGWDSIHFGVMWSKITPYCHCKEPLDIKSYLLGALMPFFVLGISIGILAIITHNPYILFLSVFNILGAGGDTTIVFKLLAEKNKKDALILDHPTEVGYVLFEKDCGEIY